MAVPKEKPSKARTRRRRSINMKAKVYPVIGCPHCGNPVIRHRVCMFCGFYRGRDILHLTDEN